LYIKYLFVTSKPVAYQLKPTVFLEK